MAGFSRDETVSLTVLAITVAVFAWYRSDMTGISRWTNAIIALFVSVTIATATLYVLKRWNPIWYRS
jgi:hypothetical protein